MILLIAEEYFFIYFDETEKRDVLLLCTLCVRIITLSSHAERVIVKRRHYLRAASMLEGMRGFLVDVSLRRRGS